MATGAPHIERSHGLTVAVGIAGAMIAFAALQLVAMSRNDWAFEYPLDDVYIHLAMAEQIARGGYGVNAGEFASAASSPLYPLLMIPFAEHDLQRWLPLFWNIIALVAASALFAMAMVQAGFGRIGAVMAAIAPLALSMYMTAFAGMENMAHIVASLAIVLGLWRFVETGRVRALLIVGVVLAPALRLEGLALSLAAGGLVAVLGTRRSGIGLMVLAILPVALFTLFLVTLGLDPLPNSVIAKLADTGGEGGVVVKFAANTNSYGGRYLFALAGALLMAGAMTLSSNRHRGLFAFAVAAAAFAHLAFGSTGWMDRYETYAVAATVAALALVLSGISPFLGQGAVAAALAGGLVTYGPYALPIYAWNPTAIAQQHGEMARFAKDFVKAPVAVNDIGYVAWHNPDYVLDLWGLASSEALALRRAGPSDDWAGALADAHGIKVAMIYDKWLGEAVPPTWQRLGTLHLDVPNAFLGGPDVAFYAVDPAEFAELNQALSDWKRGLPERAIFTDAEGPK